MRKRKETQRQTPTRPAGLSRRWVLALATFILMGTLVATYRSTPFGLAPSHDASTAQSGDQARHTPALNAADDSASRSGSAVRDPETAIPETAIPETAIPATHEQLIDDLTGMAERVVTRFPDDPMAYDLRGRIYLYLGKSDEAEAAWQRCLELESRRPDALFGLAQLAIKRGDDAAAEPLLRRALGIDPHYPQAASQLGEILMRSQRVEEAASLLQRYVTRGPSSAASLLQLAQVQLQQRDYEAAKSSFEGVIKLNPKSSEAYLGLGTVLLRLGRSEESRTCLETSRELRSQSPPSSSEAAPEDFDVTMTRANHASSSVYAARLYRIHGELREAERLSRRATLVDPKNLPSRLLLISLYQQMHRLADAVQVCEEAVAADPENADLNWRLGVLRAQAGRFDAAEAALQKVLRLAPQEAQGYAGLAEVYLESRRKPTESLRLAQEAVRLEPVALHFVLLGRIYLQAGNLTKAKEALGEAVKREPENAAFRQLYNQVLMMTPAG